MKRIVFLSIVLLLVLAPTGYALASPFDRIIREGETVDGDITVVDDRLVVEEGGVVDGDVTVFSGSAEVSGEITGDVTVFGGHLDLSGLVDGDLVIFGGALDLAQGADVGGSCVTLGGGIDDESDNVSCTAFGDRLGSTGLFQLPPMPELREMP
ncbi:MAG: bactofilin family protein, partial [Chloroflexota bacterium]